MLGYRNSWLKLLALGLAMGMPLASRPIQAQVPDPILVIDTNVLHPDGWDDEELVPNAVPRDRQVLISVSIEHWLFGNDRTHAHDLFTAYLQQKLLAVKREYEELDGLKIRKLELAGRGDIKHFHDQLSLLKARYPQNAIDQQDLHQLLAEIQTLRQRMNPDSFFGKESLFTKTLRAIIAKDHLKPLYSVGPDQRPAPGNADVVVINQQQVVYGDAPAVRLGVRKMAVVRLDAPQMLIRNPVPRAPVEGVFALRNDEYYRTLLRVISATFDPETPFREDQREPLTAMLRKASQRIPHIPLFDPEITLLRLSELPEDEYRAVLDKDQWTALRRKFEAVIDRHDTPASAPAKPPIQNDSEVNKPLK